MARNPDQPRDLQGRYDIGGRARGRRATAPPPDSQADGDSPDLTVAEWEQMWEVAQVVSRGAAHKFGVQAEEVQSCVMIGMGALRDRGTLLDDPEALRRYMSAVAYNEAWRLGMSANSGVANSRWLRAKAELAKATDGKRLTENEIADIARTVKVSNRTLPEGWHLWAEVRGDDALDAAVANRYQARSAEDEALNGPNTALQGITPESSKWEIVAAAYDAPPASEGILSENSAIKVRQMMADIGGIEDAMNAWRNEAITKEQERVLFAPWGHVISAEEHGSPHYWPRWRPPSFTDQERIVEALDRLSNHAEVAWSAAVSDATWIIRRSADERRVKPRTV